MLPFLVSRINQLNQEFAFLPTCPPHAEGGIFELRSYVLQPGTLLEWENSWYVTWTEGAFLLNSCNLKEKRYRGPT